MNVAVCAYGAGNVRSVVAAFRRLGANAFVTSSATERRRRRPCRAPRRRLGGERDGGSPRARPRRRAARAGGRGPGDARHLPRAPTRPRRVRGGRRRRRAGNPARPCASPRRRPRPADRLGAVEPSGEAFYFAHSYAAETPAATANSEGVVAIAEAGSFLGVQFHPEKSGAAGARFLAAMPLPRLIPCLDVADGRVVKGVRFQGLREVGDPVELGPSYSDAGADELVYLDVKATIDGRAALLGLVVPNRRPAGDPVHRRRRRSLGRRRGGAPGGRRGQGLRQQRGARRDRSS